LYKTFLSKDFSAVRVFPDHENVKIVAEDKIKYETVVSVMDAARGTRTADGNVTMFPNVSIAGGIIQ
jgi:biopolymer transport protein ExbD